MTRTADRKKERAVLSVHSKAETRRKLERFAHTVGRTKSALANEAIEQYLAHQEWLEREIKKGMVAADRGELVPDKEMERWFRSIGARR